MWMQGQKYYTVKKIVILSLTAMGAISAIIFFCIERLRSSEWVLAEKGKYSGGLMPFGAPGSGIIPAMLSPQRPGCRNARTRKLDA